MQNWLKRLAVASAVPMILWLAIHPASPLLSQGAGPSTAATHGELQVMSSMAPSGLQQIVVVEGGTRTMAVYHVDPAQGKIQLRSVRKLTWDLRMEQFNGQQPLPSELRQVDP
jgi:hypothetical protein